jgi:hypothetical protein
MCSPLANIRQHQTNISPCARNLLFLCDQAVDGVKSRKLVSYHPERDYLSLTSPISRNSLKILQFRSSSSSTKICRNATTSFARLVKRSLSCVQNSLACYVKTTCYKMKDFSIRHHITYFRGRLILSIFSGNSSYKSLSNDIISENRLLIVHR